MRTEVESLLVVVQGAIPLTLMQFARVGEPDPVARRARWRRVVG